jgi:uncharacterized protein (TIRG00374 family)
MNVKKTLKILFGLLITVLAVWLFLKNSDPGRIWTTVKRISLPAAGAVVFLSIFSLYLRGLRWRFMLPRVPGASNTGLFGISSVGFMVNNVLPARIGEAVRVYLLYKRNRHSMHTSIGTLLFERLLDSFFYAGFIVAASWVYFTALSGKMILDKVHALYPLKFGAGILAVLLAAFCLYRFFPARFFRLGEALAKRLWGPLSRGVGHLLKLTRESTEWVFRPRALSCTVLLSPLVIACYSLALFVIARALDIELTLMQALFASGLLAFGVAVPSSPGYIGTLHLACAAGLMLFGVERNQAAAVAVLYHLLTWLGTVAAGLFFYFRLDVNLKEIPAGAAAPAERKEIS